MEKRNPSSVCIAHTWLQLSDTEEPQNHWDYYRMCTFRKARNLHQSKGAIFLKKIPATGARINVIQAPISPSMLDIREGRVQREKS